jgi:YesN/AraC family two-component response regulator
MDNCVILCVDDEEIILNSLESLLTERFGESCLVELAQSADEGLEIIEEFKENNGKLVVIVSDWLMPGMKGDEFLIKAHGICPNVEKIMLSGHAEPTSVQKAIDEANLNKFISKPWDSNELIESIIDGLKKYGCKISS